MDFDINNLTLIDLISEKHAQLRKTVEKTWEQHSEIHFSHTEWHLLAKIEQKCMTITQAASIIGISKQAMHKSVKKLENQGIISSSHKDDNKREKFLHLTKIGNEYSRKNNQMKLELELELKNLLGRKEFEILKDLLKREWLMDEYIAD